MTPADASGSSTDVANRLHDLTEGRAPPPPPRPDPEKIALYGGLSGASLEVGIFEIVPGLVVRDTYAHVFAAYMVAFGRPPHPRAPHPGPWVSANGGFGYDVTIEVALASGVRPTSFNRLNTLWWTTALLRLRSGAALRMPVVSSAPFALAAQEQLPPTIWSIETYPRQLQFSPPAATVSEADLEWVRKVFLSGGTLMGDEGFARGFALFDGLRWAHDPRAAMTLAWTAVEAVLRPDTQGKKRALSAAMSVLLGSPDTWDRTYARVAAAYEARSNTAHAGASPETEAFAETMDLCRALFLRCLDAQELPAINDLHLAWKRRPAQQP